MAKAIIRNLLFSIFLWLILFVVDNRTWLFLYLPNQAEYEEMPAYMEYSNLKHDYVEVTVMDDEGEEVAIGEVKRAFKEHSGTMITVGYARWQIVPIVRLVPVVTWGQIAVVVWMIFANLSIIWRLHKATR
ncbi:MAG: hypothetical protein K2K10_08265 [Acetatifactor sp.]|nr:hypothetical protein [Acetatifactor sp.]